MGASRMSLERLRTLCAPGVAKRCPVGVLRLEVSFHGSGPKSHFVPRMGGHVLNMARPGHRVPELFRAGEAELRLRCAFRGVNIKVASAGVGRIFLQYSGQKFMDT